LADLVTAHRPGRGSAGGAVVHAGDLPEQQTPTGARTKRLLDTSTGDTSTGEPGLVRHQVHIPPAREFGGTAAPGGELWFVLAGSGTLTVNGANAPALHPDRGVRIPANATYVVEAGTDDLRLDVVALPSAQDGIEPAARDLADCVVETTGDREFRVL